MFSIAKTISLNISSLRKVLKNNVANANRIKFFQSLLDQRKDKNKILKLARTFLKPEDIKKLIVSLDIIEFNMAFNTPNLRMARLDIPNAPVKSNFKIDIKSDDIKELSGFMQRLDDEVMS